MLCRFGRPSLQLCPRPHQLSLLLVSFPFSCAQDAWPRLCGKEVTDCHAVTARPPLSFSQRGRNPATKKRASLSAVAIASHSQPPRTRSPLSPPYRPHDRSTVAYCLIFCRFRLTHASSTSFHAMGRKFKAKDGLQKQPLTLAELAGHDDVCSDVMIDNVRSGGRDYTVDVLTAPRPSTSSKSENIDQNTSLSAESRRSRSLRSSSTMSSSAKILLLLKRSYSICRVSSGTSPA